MFDGELGRPFLDESNHGSQGRITDRTGLVRSRFLRFQVLLKSLAAQVLLRSPHRRGERFELPRLLFVESDRDRHHHTNPRQDSRPIPGFGGNPRNPTFCIISHPPRRGKMSGRGNRNQRFYASSFRGRPRGRKHDSSPGRVAVSLVHGSPPNGRPRQTECRNRCVPLALGFPFFVGARQLVRNHAPVLTLPRTRSLRPPDLGTGQVEGRTSYLLAEMRFGKSSSERTK